MVLTPAQARDMAEDYASAADHAVFCCGEIEAATEWATIASALHQLASVQTLYEHHTGARICDDPRAGL